MEHSATEYSLASMDVWRRFVAAGRTLGPTPGERERWHAGRSRYAVWLARVTGSEFLARTRLAQQQLEQWILPIAGEQLHLTIFVCGFPTAGGTMNDDVEPEALITQANHLAAAAFAPLELQIGPVNSFTSAAFLEVQDPLAGLERIRAALGSALEHHGKREVRFSHYIPHITVGMYRLDYAITPIVEALAPLRALPPLRLRLEALELVDYETDRWDAPLRTLRRVPLVARG